MADTKWSQFPDAGPSVSTDKFVGLRGIENVQFDADMLLSQNNLSDVSNSGTARVNLNVSKISSESGSPQGAIAGILGDLYINTTAPTDKFYVCIVAGTSSTAIWQLQNSLAGALLSANNLSDVANAVTALSNLGGQPIIIEGEGSPNGSQAGTLGESLYFDSNLNQLWECVLTGSSTTAMWQRIVNAKNVLNPHSFYFSTIKGDDTQGNGSQEFPFKSYGVAAAAAVLVATATNPATVIAMGQETVSGGISFYPFVNVIGLLPSGCSLQAVGAAFSLDPSFDSTPNPVLYATNITLISDLASTFTFNVEQNAQMIFYNAPFKSSSPVTINGSSGANNELWITVLDVITSGPPAYVLLNLTAAFEVANTTSISMDNQFSAAQSLLIIANSSTPDANGDIVVSGESPYPGTVLYTTNCAFNSVTLNGMVQWLTDAESYTDNITFLNGTNFSNIAMLTTADAINANDNFTPTNYTLPVATLYPDNCVTNNLQGIDNALGTFIAPSFAGVSFASTAFTIAMATDTPLNQAIYSTPELSPDFSVSPTGVITYSGSASARFLISFIGSSLISLSGPIRFFIGINGVIDLRSEQTGTYSSSQYTISPCQFVINLNPGDTVLAYARNDTAPCTLLMTVSSITVVKC